eukprot:NODE_242_length_13076_cov_0.518379.p5 type:complete len:328 gc:universal NODE_242_length_13076_cov_0.518379:12420-11437(-)
MSQNPEDVTDPLQSVREYMAKTTCVDTLADSMKTVILDSNLLLTKGASALIQHSTLGLPVVNDGSFVAVLGTNDILLLMHHFYHHGDVLQAKEILKSFRIADVFSLKRPPGLQHLNVSFNPEITLLEAAKLMLSANQFRAALVHIHPDGSAPNIENYLPGSVLSPPGHHSIISVITNYKILKSISENCPVELLSIPANQLMTKPQYTAVLSTPIIDLIEMIISCGANAIPILDASGCVVNVYESPDILQFVTETAEFDLKIPVQEAILKRSPDFEGVHTCKEIDSLGFLISSFKKSTVHRILVVDEHKKLLGIIRLVDIIRFLVFKE